MGGERTHRRGILAANSHLGIGMEESSASRAEEREDVQACDCNNVSASHVRSDESLDATQV